LIPPAGEVRPCFGGVTLDRESDLAHPGDRVEEFLVTQADAALRVVLIGYLDAHRPGDPVEGLESAAQA
jgi:3'-phosphoadenosine 5'-phosphosulfate (PAPS) 3'-phosphatase